MKAAEEYYDRYDSLYNSSGLCHAEAFEQIMNEARKECLEECAEKAKSEWIRYGTHMGHAVDRQSILSLIDELK